MERGLDISEGVLVIVDGGKGPRAAVKRAFGNRALVQRCQWHKRENVVRWDGIDRTEKLTASPASDCNRSAIGFVHIIEYRVAVSDITITKGT